LFRVDFLDFDGFGLMSTVEQNFNPNISTIEHRQKYGKNATKKIFCSSKKKFFLGYPRLLSGDMKFLSDIPSKQTALFPEKDVDVSWDKVNTVKRFYVNLPMYPFRTLSSRDSYMLLPSGKSHDFDIASPLFPANTHISIQLKKRDNRNFLRHMLPFNLDPNLGSLKNSLTAEEKKAASLYSIRKGTPPAKVDYVITRVDIDVQDMYLQVDL
jgi:hypothetical protein